MPPSLLIENDLRKKFSRKLRKSGSREIGGILFGEQLESGSFRLADFSLDDVTGGEAHFCRSAEHHIETLEIFFKKTGHDYKRYNYLGEWHSHPRFPVAPSHQDLISMSDLVSSERGIHFAALLIVRLDFFLFLKTSAHMFSRGGAIEDIKVRNKQNA